MTGTLSWTISFSTVATASVGLDLLSSTISSIFLPSTPPAALICLLGDLGALGDVVAGRGEGAGERLGDADLDGVLRRSGAAEEQCARECGERKGEGSGFHDASPVS